MPKLKKEIDQSGTIRYFDHNHKFHRLNGPAIIYANGTKYWSQHGKLHRLNHPAIIYPDGETCWYIYNINSVNHLHQILTYLKLKNKNECNLCS